METTATTTTPRRRGRPKDPNKKQMYSLRISTANREYLQTIPEGQRSDLINRLLSDHIEKTAFLQARKAAIERLSG